MSVAYVHFVYNRLDGARNVDGCRLTTAVAMDGAVVVTKELLCDNTHVESEMWVRQVS